LFGKLRARSRLGVVINIVPPVGTARRGRSCRVEGCLWAIEKTRAWCCCTFGAKTNVIDFGSGGTRIAIFLQDNWIFYTASEKKKIVYFHNRRCSARAHLDSRLSYRFALTCSGQWNRPSHLQLPPQLRPSCLGLDPPLQSPALVAWRAAVLRLWGGRGRRRFRRYFLYRCRRKQRRSLVRFPQVSHCRYKPNTSLSHTSNSGPVAPIIISCCRCCLPRRAE